MRSLLLMLTLAALAAPGQTHPASRNPAGEFPTGPGIGAKLPPITLAAQNGQPATVSGPAAVVFFRSAVW